MPHYFDKIIFRNQKHFNILFALRDIKILLRGKFLYLYWLKFILQKKFVLGLACWTLGRLEEHSCMQTKTASKQTKNYQLANVKQPGIIFLEFFVPNCFISKHEDIIDFKSYHKYDSTSTNFSSCDHTKRYFTDHHFNWIEIFYRVYCWGKL